MIYSRLYGTDTSHTWSRENQQKEMLHYVENEHFILHIEHIHSKKNLEMIPSHSR